MAVEIGSTCLWVSDLEASERFYVGGLGLSVTARIETDAYREIVLAQPEKGAQLMLAIAKNSEMASIPRGIWKVFLFSDAIDSDFERVVAAGAKTLMQPTLHQGVGFKIAQVEDLDGFILELGQRVSDC